LPRCAKDIHQQAFPNDAQRASAQVACNRGIVQIACRRARSGGSLVRRVAQWANPAAHAIARAAFDVHVHVHVRRSRNGVPAASNYDFVPRNMRDEKTLAA
jgi:hypothetical protein